MKPEDSALMRKYDAFVQEMPKESRAKLYEFAGGFLSIGAMHGAFAGLAAGVGTQSEGDQQEAWLDYLGRKQAENSSED